MKGDTARTDLVVKAMTIIDGKMLSDKILKEVEEEKEAQSAVRGRFERLPVHNNGVAV